MKKPLYALAVAVILLLAGIFFLLLEARNERHAEAERRRVEAAVKLERETKEAREKVIIEHHNKLVKISYSLPEQIDAIDLAVKLGAVPTNKRPELVKEAQAVVAAAEKELNTDTNNRWGRSLGTGY